MSFRGRATRVVLIGALSVWAIIAIGPIIWVYYSSFKTNAQIVSNIWALPHPWVLGNWITVLTSAVNSVPFITNIMNTLIVGIPAVIVVILAGSLAGFALARFRFAGAQAFQLFLLLLLPVPQFAVMVPVWSYMHTLGLTNSRLGLFLVYAAFNLALAITLMRGFFSNFPSDILEAALLDGCTEWYAFWRIVVPLSVGPMVTVGILTFSSVWNEFLFAVSLIQDPSKMTVQPALAALSAGATGQLTFGWAQQFSALAITTIIPVILFLVFQNRIFRAVTLQVQN